VENELPKKTEHIIKVELSIWQKILYNYITQSEAGEISHQDLKQGKIFVNNIIMQ
jgi:SNF2 family DNA or RNA helicase